MSIALLTSLTSKCCMILLCLTFPHYFFLQMEALLNQENLNHCVKKSVCALLLFFSSKDIIKHF